MRKILCAAAVAASLFLSSCGRAYDPDVTQSLSEINVYSTYDPYSIMQVNDGNDYDITITENTIDTSRPGSYAITFTVSDGKHEKEFTYPVRVADLESPVLTQTRDIVVETGTDFAAWFDPALYFTAVDNYDGDITDRIKWEGSVDTSRGGTTEIRLSVSDSSSNATSLTASVRIQGLMVQEDSDSQEAE